MKNKLKKCLVLSPCGTSLLTSRVSEDLKHLKTWRRLALGLPVKPEKCREIPDSFLLNLDEELAPWGELALHLERPDHPNPRSLYCHKLSGTPVPGCTHEIYAWSDKNAGRIFGICHGHRRFEIKQLGEHL